MTRAFIPAWHKRRIAKAPSRMIAVSAPVAAAASLHTISFTLIPQKDTRRQHSGLLQAPFKVRRADVASKHGLLDVLFKQSPVALQNFRGVLVERVLGVWLKEEVLQAVDNRVDREHRLPVFAQNVETDVTIQVYVWVIDHCVALDLGRFVRVVWTYAKAEHEASVSVEALVGANDQFEIQQIVRIWELHLTGLGQVQLVDVLRNA